MARTKEAKLSRSAYFKELFAANKELLKDASNVAVLVQWQLDHPGEEVTDQIRSILSNTKSFMRKKLGIKRRGRRRRKLADAAAAPTAAARPRVSAATLETLETRIDDVLALARHHEKNGLMDVIKHLRFARNGIVMKQGSP